MDRNTVAIIYLLAMILTIVLVDVFFFRHHFWERLMSNVGIVLIYVSFYLVFLKHS